MVRTKAASLPGRGAMPDPSSGDPEAGASSSIGGSGYPLVSMRSRSRDFSAPRSRRVSSIGEAGANSPASGVYSQSRRVSLVHSDASGHTWGSDTPESLILDLPSNADGRELPAVQALLARGTNSVRSVDEAHTGTWEHATAVENQQFEEDVPLEFATWQASPLPLPLLCSK